MTIDEISFAVKNMNTNKSPGPDGLTVEFYRKFWDILAFHLVLVFNSCFEAGEMFESMKTSNTRVIYIKRGTGNLLKIGDRSPFSMLIIKSALRLSLFAFLKSWNSLLILTKHALFLGGRFHGIFILLGIFEITLIAQGKLVF